MQEIVALIANVGFPIAITLYVLMRLETKMEKLNDNIVQLTNVIEVMKNN
ncbi:MAG: YvrJ family protein [Peptostreptococcaceae bacterium]|jgi:hypothetical protein|nr:YvrJ family protein [Peptostreptococcaceae bacterium]